MNNIPKRSSAAVLFSLYVCVEAFFVSANVSGPAWRRLFSLSNTQLGLCLGAAGAGVLLASLLAGHATERKGPLRMLTFALGGALLALIASASALNFVMLFSALLAVGVCVAASHNASITLLSDIFPLRFRRVMSLASALWFGSSVVTAPAAGYWLDYTASAGREEWGLRFIFVFLACLLAVCLALFRLRFRWLRGGYRPPAPRENGVPVRHEGRRQWLWVPLLGFLHGMMLVSMLAWINPMAQDVLGKSQFMGSVLFGTFSFGLGTGRLLLFAWHSRVWEDDRKVLAASGFASCVFFILVLLSGSYEMTLIFVFAGAFSCSATGPCLFSIVPARFPLMRSRLYGYMEASIAAAALSGSFLVGLFYDLGVPLRASMGLSPLAAFFLGVSALLWKKKTPFRPPGD